MKYWASEPIDDLQIKVKIMIHAYLLLALKYKHALLGTFLLNGYVKSITELCLV